ncbi:type IV pilus biogenesis protein PilM [Dickeya dianthicola]|uniref:type IV pilus biogenesis protein PilM n=1 Tax=Dickeya dianthicola TaxID=204039 RepID=UPI0003A9432F|nr:type IV pilus biogenesis protein PilM [Dickeya dianthicola]MCI4031505.1 type IV pilus biogenesis protein PilM [Dickeya dianthicola]MCI4174569.1 type IV pilus biogenesis protein PilM [Dickeya dianthicola]MCI4179571.1 type IV pilus biogenesis protein PilM [Dickeya dianthicola]MCI4180322.1 type IV pilus biogenesis protein PilM [Dickeya dianthicola]MCI4194079.1 type IV pilus biogenesis protein PilM [Dickeya dianthicola]
MGYALPVFVFCLVIALMAGDAQRRSAEHVRLAQLQTQPSQLATDILRTADAVNNWRHGRTVADGPVSSVQVGIVPVPDSRIQTVIQGGRLWVWVPATDGVFAALRTQSVTSALALTVSNGRLRMADGTDMNLPLPSGVMEGSIVYLN